MNNSNHILIPYPDEDLFEDGELSNEPNTTMVGISEVEVKIIQMWRKGKIQIARWEELNG
mgnify:CR=1 FL=1|jgi:hypothetical protein|tara:strand:- start:27 stop:206 length:180 start_codon:yes stop_codon:yes gene_type:complete